MVTAPRKSRRRDILRRIQNIYSRVTQMKTNNNTVLFDLYYSVFDLYYCHGLYHLLKVNKNPNNTSK
jgi:hypothetical protein